MEDLIKTLIEPLVTDIKKVKIVPTSTFKEHNLQPHPGLQINVDGEMGTITSISGGRAGKPS